MTVRGPHPGTRGRRARPVVGPRRQAFPPYAEYQQRTKRRIPVFVAARV